MGALKCTFWGSKHSPNTAQVPACLPMSKYQPGNIFSKYIIIFCQMSRNDKIQDIFWSDNLSNFDTKRGIGFIHHQDQSHLWYHQAHQPLLHVCCLPSPEGLSHGFQDCIIEIFSALFFLIPLNLSSNLNSDWSLGSLIGKILSFYLAILSILMNATQCN